MDDEYGPGTEIELAGGADLEPADYGGEIDLSFLDAGMYDGNDVGDYAVGPRQPSAEDVTQQFLLARPHLAQQDNLELFVGHVQARAAQLGDASLASNPAFWQVVDAELLAQSGDLEAKAQHDERVAQILNAGGHGSRVLNFIGGPSRLPAAAGSLGSRALDRM